MVGWGKGRGGVGGGKGVGVVWWRVGVGEGGGRGKIRLPIIVKLLFCPVPKRHIPTHVLSVRPCPELSGVGTRSAG